jgi:hypothetical protein
MKNHISPLRCLAVFGKFKDALNPAEARRYDAHKRTGKHSLNRMRRDFAFGVKAGTRKRAWKEIQAGLARRAKILKSVRRAA